MSTIRRAARPTSNFYMLDKSISEDEELTWAARGMLVFLLGKPDHWIVNVQHLINQTEGTRSKSGRDAVRAILRELSDVGYIKKCASHGDGGRFNGYIYEITEVKEKPSSYQPETPKPASAEPLAANHPLVSIDVLASTEDKEDKPRKRSTSTGMIFKTFLDECKTKEEKPIPDDHYIRHWADTAGIENVMLAMAWDKFKEMHTTGSRSTKKYKDWRQTFSNAVKDNWFKFWYVDDSGNVQWTTQGKMHKMAFDAQHG